MKNGSAELHYEIYGEGPPVVFAHGAGGNTLIWWQQIPHFAARHRVVVFDHRGWGRSRCPGADVDPRLFPGDLLAVFDAAKVGRGALVCQSMGGFTGLPFAVANPGRVNALVLAGTPGGVESPGVAADRQLVIERRPATPRLEMVLARSFVEREPARAHLYGAIADLNPPESMTAISRKLWEVRVSDAQLAAFPVPTLVLCGTEDWFFRAETLAEVAARIPGARFHSLPGIGHSTYFEVPDAFNRIVGDFVGQYAGA